MKNLKFRTNKIGDVIVGPLLSVITANSTIQREQAKLFLELCFEETSKGSMKPKSVTLSLNQAVPVQDQGGGMSFENVEMSFNIPLLTLIPFSNLAIEEFNIDFSMEITKQSTKTLDNLFTSDLSGKISPNQKNETNNSNTTSNKSVMNIEIKAGTIDLPNGLKSILEIYEKNIRPVNSQLQ